MGKTKEYIPEKLIIGILTVEQQLPDALLQRVVNEFGPVERIDGPFSFDYTRYYNEEMGENIQKYFLTFAQLVLPDRLAEIKEFTNQVEEEWSSGSKRRVNLDPGILSETRFILATTKDRGHRVPLKNGMYAEVTLIYMQKEFQPLPWTYADFCDLKYRTLLKEIRKFYLQQIKNNKK
ncbi:MAG: DUF4416 family protein [Spirochaetia bacterium]|nr:DUF4416 family protein [Spirochaetia bacterium]